MQKIKIKPTRKAVQTTEYQNLAGIDLSQEPALVDKNRSPFCLNMISDNGKNPIKRCGWKTVLKLSAPVHNIWHTRINGVYHCIAHAGNKIYEIKSEESGYTSTILKDNVTDKKGCGFFFREGNNDGFYILTGGEYLVFNGKEIKDVSDVAYIPTTIIARKPNGGGDSYEDINLLSGKMTEKFTGDTSLIYQLSRNDIVSVDKIEELQKDSSVKELQINTDYSVDLKLGKVTFVAKHETPIEGHDNIYITYTKNFEGYKEKIVEATQYCFYGVGGNNRVFLTCSPKYMAYDFWSDIYKPSYFPDLNFAIVGSANTKIMGYLKIGDNVAIVKETTGQDTSIFLRNGSLQSDGSVLFTVRPGIVGTGAVSQYSFAVLNDDPLFLSDRGIYSISASNLSYDRVTRNRSWYIDPQLREETNLSEAVCCVWNGCYLCCINGNVYILDGRKKTIGGTDNDYKYECYLWDNVPASCLSVDFKEKLWFGTSVGDVRIFKAENESGMQAYSDDGKAIRAIWATPFTDDKSIQYFKTLQKKGCLVVLAPFTRSSCNVYYAVDGKPQKYIRSGTMDISSWFERIDFDRFTFDSSDAPREIYFNKKQRKYKRIQLIFENKEVDEGFGIYKIVKTFVLNGYSKNRR